MITLGLLCAGVCHKETLIGLLLRHKRFIAEAQYSKEPISRAAAIEYSLLLEYSNITGNGNLSKQIAKLWIGR